MTRIDIPRGELHITDIGTARRIDKSRFDRIITVCQDCIADNVSRENTIYSYYNMSDGTGDVEQKYGGRCTYEMFSNAATELFESLDDGETVLIHCHHGQSRSAAVSMAAIGRLFELNLTLAVSLVEQSRPIVDPNGELLDHVAKYIREHS